MILYVISVGLSVTMGLMGFINLAHGVFAMAGGFLLSTAMARWSIPFPLAVALAFVLVSIGSVALERLLYSRLYGSGELAQVLFSIGLILVSMASARLIFGDQAARIFLPDYMRGQLHMLGRDFPTYRVFIIVFFFCFYVFCVGGWGGDGGGGGGWGRAGPHRAAWGLPGENHPLPPFMLPCAPGGGPAGLGGALGPDILPNRQGPGSNPIYL